MEKVIALKPGFEGGGAYMILGRMNFKVPKLLGGDNAKAVEQLKKAIEYGPQRWINHITLAEVYINQNKQILAQGLLNQVLEGPCEKFTEPECKQWKAKAKALMAKVEKSM